jgi:hypothetical protein
MRHLICERTIAIAGVRFSPETVTGKTKELLDHVIDLVWRFCSC